MKLTSLQCMEQLNQNVRTGGIDRVRHVKCVGGT
jgi:hypothetical protein